MIGFDSTCHSYLNTPAISSMEKPVSATWEDAMKIKHMADEYDAKIMVGFAHYYRPAYRKMLELVRTGMFGRPVNIAFSRLSPGFGFHAKNMTASWRTDPNLACGMTIESVSHDWKLINAMAGSFEAISCNYTGTLESVPRFDNHIVKPQPSLPVLSKNSRLHVGINEDEQINILKQCLHEHMVPVKAVRYQSVL